MHVNTVTATSIFKQSVSFYGRLFNKLFWLSVASSIAPLLLVQSEGEPSMAVTLIIMITSMFFSVYMMAIIHQFSQTQNDSLSEAFSLTLKKVMPVTLTSFVLGLAVVVFALPVLIVATMLAGGIDSEKLKSLFIAALLVIPISMVMYRGFFAPYFTLVDGLSPVAAIKASNEQVKKNKLIFNGFMLLSLVMLAYILLLLLVGSMIVLNPTALAFAEFIINVLMMPFISVYIYRLFVVSKPCEKVDEIV